MPRRAHHDSDAALLASRLIRRQGPDAFGCDRRSDSSSSLLARAIHDHFRVPLRTAGAGRLLLG